MAKQESGINSKMLRWARVEAGYSLAKAAKLAKVRETKTKTPQERLAAWESGSERPTPRQLRELAKAYFWPEVTFYLDRPPTTDTGVADFRTVGNRTPRKYSPKLRALIAKMKARQQEVLELLADDEEDPPQALPFVGRFRRKRNVVAVARNIEEVLALPVSSRNRRNEVANDNPSLLRIIRDAAEGAGIYVLAQGDLGSYHTDIDRKEFRGFALADPIAPFVVINDNDYKVSQPFTLVHELAHVWIGRSGVSNFDPFGRVKTNDQEEFCDSVAAEFLMPRETFTQSWQNHESADLLRTVDALARGFGVSKMAAARRLREIDAIPESKWWQLFKRYRDENEEREAKRKAASKGGPNYYTSKKAQLGKRFVSTILDAVEAQVMTYTRASHVLGVLPQNFDGLK